MTDWTNSAGLGLEPQEQDLLGALHKIPSRAQKHKVGVLVAQMGDA